MSNEHSAVEIENAVLGLLLENSSAINKVKGVLKAVDFFEYKNRQVFSVIEELSDEGTKIEVAAIIQRLKDKSVFNKVGKEEYLFKLINASALESNLNKFIKIISDKAQLRKVQEVLKRLNININQESASPDVLIEQVENEILATTRSTATKDFEHSGDIVKLSMENIEKRATGVDISGIKTEITSLDKLTSGLQRGDLIILAARPSMGKTAFALNIAANVAKKHVVAFFSLEMPAEQLVNRVLSSTSFINAQKLKEPNTLTSNEWVKLNSASDKVASLNLYIDDSAGLKLNELIWKAKKLHSNKSLDMIVIDYMQLIVATFSKGVGDNRQAEVSAISRALKQLARELEVPVIALSQLSRRVEQREDKKPMMSDLRESGAIEQDADLIMFLYREAYYKKELEKEERKHQETDIIISKHRNGATGGIKLIFNPSIGLFSERMDE